MQQEKIINESVVAAGFGGQGVMMLGKFLAYAAMSSGLEVTYIPSYGAEVRGGTAHSYVKISSSKIYNPLVEMPQTAIIMNGPSLEKFENKIQKNGLLILNTSMCDVMPERKDIDLIRVSLTEEAVNIGNQKVANIIAAGIYIGRKNIFDKEIMLKTIKNMSGKRKELIPVNVKALERGIEIGSV